MQPVYRSSVSLRWTAVFVVLLALGAIAPLRAACPDFAAKVNYGTGAGPYSVVPGDFNRDGKADLAVANMASTTVSILLSVGDGTFQAAVSYGAGTNPYSVATSDFNGDGIADLAVANGGSNNVSMLAGNGDGTFQTAVNYGAGTKPYSVATDDFNGDGKADLAVANFGSNNVSILLGNGDGTFATAVKNYGAGTNPHSVTTADFNGDGKADLAVANFGSSVSILLGNGDGTFAVAVNYAAGTNPRSLAAADFNGDGKADLAVANYGSDNVSILLGIGDGTFATAVNYGVGDGPRSIATGDFNGDGKADLAAGNVDTHNVSILLSNGDGTFAAAVNYGAGTYPAAVATGDFDADGKGDLAVANYGSNNLSILLNSGVCSLSCGALFNPAVEYAAGTAPVSTATGDFNGDGKADLAVANWNSDDVSILLGDGAGAFPDVRAYSLGQGRSVVTADFNADGKADLAFASPGAYALLVLLGNGDGTFGNAVEYRAGSSPPAVAVADFNGDGKPDLVSANAVSNDVSVLLGKGDGTFGAPASYAAGTSPYSLVTGDFNRDGKADVAVVNQGSSTVSILLGNGDGSLYAKATYGLGSYPQAIATGDFNGDAKADLVVANRDSQNVSVLLGNGDGTFAAAPSAGGGIMSPMSVAAGDFNGDGKADLAVANFFSRNVSILLGSGDGTFAAAVNHGAGGNPMAVATADFNGDGKSDLAVVNSTSNNVSILLGGCPGPTISSVTPNSGTNGGGTPITITGSNFQTGATVTIGTATATVSSVGSGSINAITPSGTVGPMTVTVTNPDGRTASLSAGFTYVCIPPDATVSASGPTTFCAGGSVTLTAASGVSWLWSTGAISQSITVKTSGTYTVKVTNALGCSASGSKTVVTNPLPTPVVTQTVNGSFITLTASPASSYQWSTGATEPSININTPGTYGVQEVNEFGCAADSPLAAAEQTPSGSNVGLVTGNVTTVFDTVLRGGLTSFIGIPAAGAAAAAGPLPAGMEVSELDIAYDGATTSQVSGSAVVEIHLTPQQLAGISPAMFFSLRILHLEFGGVLADRTIMAPDSPVSEYTTGSLYARVGSLSPFIVARTNAATLSAIAGPSAPLSVAAPVNVSASFTDTDVQSHTALWEWGDGTSSVGTIIEQGGSGNVTGTHAYTTAGIYGIKLTVTNSRGLTAQQTFQYAVIYDPNAGFVTGGGTFAEGSGKAHFGFVVKYQKDSTTPTGQCEFQFANSNFHSTGYEWLVITGSKARFQGSGTIDGKGEYGFLINAVDGDVSGGDGIDRFRIRIWTKSTGQTVYDSGSGPDDDVPNPIGSGSIVIH